MYNPAMKFIGCGIAGLVLVGLVACKEGKSDSRREHAATPDDVPVDEMSDSVVVAAQVEHRLYSDKIEASSFLWGNTNRFQENYHPNYLMDGDPETTWIEGVAGDGHGEWVRIHTSKVENATRLRLRLRNGYHKSKALYGKNARIKELKLRILPGGTTQTMLLADKMEWLEVQMPLSGDDFAGVALEVVSTYPGTKYEDTCISDVEIFVSGERRDGAIAEKKKLATITTWKQERRKSARLFASDAARALPIRAEYRVSSGPTFLLKKLQGKNRVARAALMEVTAQVADTDSVLNRAKEALFFGFEEWKAYRLRVRTPVHIPALDGLRLSELGASPEASDSFIVPSFNQKSLLTAKSISLSDAKAGEFNASDEECRENTVWAARPNEIGPTPKQLVVWKCTAADDSTGTYRELVWQLFGFDDEGWLRVVVGPQYAQYFDWKHGDKRSVLIGGVRLRSWADSMELLTSQASETNGSD